MVHSIISEPVLINPFFPGYNEFLGKEERFDLSLFVLLLKVSSLQVLEHKGSWLISDLPSPPFCRHLLVASSLQSAYFFFSFDGATHANVLLFSVAQPNGKVSSIRQSVASF